MNTYIDYTNAKHDLVAIADPDQLVRDALERGKKINPEVDAEYIRRLIKVLSARCRCYALVSEHDDRLMKAYRKADFEIIPVNGNRTETVARFINQQSGSLRTGQIRDLVLITTDPTFTVLAEQADPKTTRVSVWAPVASVHRELTLPPYQFRDLDEILPGSPQVAILVDFENIWYGVKNKLGSTPNLESIIEAIKKVGDEFGEIKKITAYADWDLLAKDVQRNIQRELVQKDVDTQYLINMRGKNTADMRVANDMRDMIERGHSGRDDVDTILLVTGDRDFRDIVKTAILRGKKVIIMAVRNGLSHDLENAASEVRYVDDYLKLPVKLSPNNETTEPVVRPWHPAADLALKLLLKTTGNGTRWISNMDLETLGFTSLADTIEQGLKDGLISREPQADASGQMVEGVKLNFGNIVVKVMSRLLWWAPGRITYCKTNKGMPYLDTAYFSNGFTMDRQFQTWGIGQTRSEANGWLDLLARNGVLVKKSLPGKMNPERMITAWSLPESSASQVEAPATPWPTAKPASPQPEEHNPASRPPKDGPLSAWGKLLGSPA
jgi:uncharacterized LabA/DUF88 family protein